MNLIISSAKGLEAKASAEFKEIALLHGIRKFQIEKSEFDGLLEIDVEDPRGVMAILRDYIRSEPFRVHFILRVIPVDLVIDTKLEEIAAAAKQLGTMIGEGESFRITIEARDSPYSNKQLIDAIAENIDRKVNLETPDRLILVEIFGEYTTLSLLKPDEILSVVKLKRAS